jgi:cell division protein FtsZ
MGVGGAGINAVNRMIEAGLSGVEFVAIDFDYGALESSKAANKLRLESLYPPLTFPEFGDPPRIRNRESALAGREQIRMAIGKADVVFIIAGMGGGTGSGAAPVIAEAARETGAIAIAVVTRPFGFEGKGRLAVAKTALKDLSRYVDTVIVIPDDGILETAHEKASGLTRAFQAADDILWRTVRCIVGLMSAQCFVIPSCPNAPNYWAINIMENLVRSKQGTLLEGRLGIGLAGGKNRAKEAAQMAMASPLLEESFNMASGVLMLFFCAPDVTLFEINEVADILREASRPSIEIIWDVTLDNSLTDKIYLLVVCLYEKNELKAAD